MRYRIGEEIPVVQFLPAALSGHPSKLYHDPCLLINSPIREIRLNLLTVVEHHLVASSRLSSVEKTLDGFVLKDNGGNVWHNQYPIASGGYSVDDFAPSVNSDNYRFLRAAVDEETNQSLFDNPQVLVMEYRSLDRAALKIFRGVRYMMTRALKEQDDNVRANLYKLSEHLTSLYGQLKSEFERSLLFEGKTFRVREVLLKEPHTIHDFELRSGLKFEIIDRLW